MTTSSKRTCFIIFCLFTLCTFSIASVVGNTPPAGSPTEIVSGRNANTRVWQTTNIENAVDLVTGLPTGTQNTTYPIYYERADGLCYQDTANNWQVSVESIQSTQDGTYQALQGPYQIKFTGSISASFPVTYTANGDILRMGLRSIGFYNMQTNTLQTLQVVSQSYPVLNGNTLTYPGVFPGIDVQYQYLRGSFEQKLILQNNSSLPSPSIFNMDTTVYLVSITEIDTSSVSCSITNSAGESLTNGFLSGENQSLYFTDSSTGNTICQFVVSQAFDSQNNGLPLNMYKQIYQADGHLYLLEGVPYSWVQSSQYPITLDYQTKSNSQSDNEVWKSGNTYYLSGTYTVSHGYALAIEGGAVIKVIPYSVNSVSGALVVDGQITTRGDKFNFVLFSSANDNSVGATISGYSTATPAPGDYNVAIQLNSDALTTSRIQYCKIAYGKFGLYLSTKLSTVIAHNIIQNCSYGIVSQPADSGVNTVNIINNLIALTSTTTPNSYGLYLDTNQNTTYNNVVKYNTFAGPGNVNGTQGIYIVGNASLLNSSILTIYDNIFSQFSTGINSAINYDTTSNPTPINYNTYTKCSNDLSSNIPYHTNDYSDNSRVSTGHAFSGNVFETGSPNGSYYLVQSQGAVIGNGSEAASSYGLNTKTTETASLILGNITGTPIWLLVPRDTGSSSDRGYHYDPVDVIIGNSASNYSITVSEGGNTLTIDSGVVVSFYRDSTDTGGELSNEATLTAIGQPGNEIQFTSIYATSDLNTLPLRGGLDTNDYFAIVLSPSSNPASNIQYCQFAYAQYGLDEEASLNIDKPIQNNIFKNDIYGIYFDCSSAVMANVVNNLFINNMCGAELLVAGPPSPWMINYLQSNTFYGNGTGVFLANEGSLTLRLENNIFLGNSFGVFTSYGTFTLETRNNLYWDNGQNTNGVPLNTTGGDNADITGANPMVVHQATLANNAFLSSTAHDGFYLAQNSGDASRFPLQISSVSGMSFSFASTPPSGVKITVSSYSNGLSGSTQLGYATTLNGGGWSYTSTGSGLGNILITLNAGANGWTISSTDSITLLFGSDSIRVYLPKGSLYETQVQYWTALDGSSYYESPSVTRIPEDAWFAMEYDMPLVTGRTGTGLAQSAYSAGGRSASVDQGAVKTTTLTGGTTYRYSIFASLGNTNTNGTQDNGSTFRIIAPTLPTSTTDPLGRLDIGYHYNGSVVYTTDVFGNISTVYNVETTVLLSESEGSYFIGKDVVSGAWNSNTLVDQSMVLYCNGCHTSSLYLEGCGYHVPNTPINNQLVTGNGSSSAPWPGVASLAVSLFDNTIVGGLVYSDLTNHLRIYKYLSDTSGWSLMGSFDFTSTYPSYIGDLSLSVGQDSNVWVTWGLNVQSASKLCATRLSLSTSNVTLNAGNVLISNWNGAAAAGGHAISMSYDPQAVGYVGSDTSYGVRLAFLNNPSTGTTGLWESPLLVNKSGAISFEYNSPTLGKPVTESGQNAGGNVRLVYNPNYTGSAPAFQDFSSALEQGYLRAYDLSTPSSDIWTPDNAYSPTSVSTGGTGSGETDLTYRSTGEKLTVWQTGEVWGAYYLTTNQGNAVTLFGTTGHPRITTNTVNRRDTVLAWDDSYAGFSLPLLFVKELYP